MLWCIGCNQYVFPVLVGVEADWCCPICGMIYNRELPEQGVV